MIQKSYPAPLDMNAKAQELAAHGITIDPAATSGELKHGSYDFTYQIAEGKIIVTEVHKPSFVPDGLVWKQIDGFFAEPE